MPSSDALGRPSGHETSRPGLLLVGHGTREPAGVQEFLELARQLAAQTPEAALEPCFLELAEPTVAAGIARLLERGIGELIVAPVFLFAAGHAKRDLPEAVVAALGAAGRESMPRRQVAPLGLHPDVLALSRRRYEAALAGRVAVPAADSALVMIGRGSSDPEATADMHRYAAAHGEQLGLGRWEVGFLAVAHPTLAQALRAAARHGARRIVVQPHLLFEGLLAAEVRQAVARAQGEWPSQEWLVTHPLGVHERLILALRSLCGLDEMRPGSGLRSAPAAVFPDKTVQTTCVPE
jgi:sirohydrochlorin cobaltochelatase